MNDFFSDITSGAVGGVVSSLAVLALQLYLQKRWEHKKDQQARIVGHGGQKELAGNFLSVYQPGISLDKVIEALGQPDGIEYELTKYHFDDDPFPIDYTVYKFRFFNATVLFATKNGEKEIVAITVEGLYRDAPIEVFFGPASNVNGLMPDRAKIDKHLLENVEQCFARSYAQWGFSALQCRWGGYKKLKHLTYTYITYEVNYEKPAQFLGREIHQVCVSSIATVCPIVHFYENN